MNFRRITASIISGLVPNRALRTRVRLYLRHPHARQYVRFVRNWANGNVREMRLLFGVGGRNLIIVLNREHVFKFSLYDDGRAQSVREKRIVDAMMNVSPIPIPPVDLIEFNNVVVRHYPFFSGRLIGDFSRAQIAKHRDKLARTLANFIYVVGASDVPEIQDLKPVMDAKPGFLYGWFHNDIARNFMMDDDMNITGFIDWENTAFCDFKIKLANTDKHWNEDCAHGLVVDVLSYYAQKYISNNCDCK